MDFRPFCLGDFFSSVKAFHSFSFFGGVAFYPFSLTFYQIWLSGQIGALKCHIKEIVKMKLTIFFLHSIKHKNIFSFNVPPYEEAKICSVVITETLDKAYSFRNVIVTKFKRSI